MMENKKVNIIFKSHSEKYYYLSNKNVHNCLFLFFSDGVQIIVVKMANNLYFTSIRSYLAISTLDLVLMVFRYTIPVGWVRWLGGWVVGWMGGWVVQC